MQFPVTVSVVLLSTAISVSAETLCPDSTISVTASNPEHTEMICDAVARTKTLFQECSVPAISRPVQIDVVDEIYSHCMAVYHCGEDLIELLSPSLMQERRDEEAAFDFLPADAYFQSVVVHELTHAAFDVVPCPIESCVVGSEYVAYTLQVLSLTPQERQSFVENAGYDRKIVRDELSALILYMAPHVFAQKAWTHFSQREDPCGYIGQIVDGTVLLDFEMFE